MSIKSSGGAEIASGKLMYASVTLVVIGLVAFVMHVMHHDVHRGQRILAGLVRGHASVSRGIAWERLKALDVDVGATYTHLPNDQERRAYERSFISHFAEGFRLAGGNSTAFTNWRVQERTDHQVVIAVDYPIRHKTLLLSLDGTGRLEAIQWR